MIVFFAFVSALLISTTVYAESQHMICKTVDGVFTNEHHGQPHVGVRGPTQYARPGKIGPKGFKGDQGVKGDRGFPGIVDYTVMEQNMEEVVSGLQAKIDRLERRLDQINQTVSEGAFIEIVCEEGFIYKGKCYFIAVERVKDKAGAETLCYNNGGRLADILDAVHQTMFERDSRGKTNGNKYYWTAMIYQYLDRTVRLTDGNQIASSSLRWRSGYPSGSSTGMKIYIHQDESSSANDVYNLGGDSNGALCKKGD